MADGVGEGRYAASIKPRSSMFNHGGVPNGNRTFVDAENTGDSEPRGVIWRARWRGSGVVIATRVRDAQVDSLSWQLQAVQCATHWIHASYRIYASTLYFSLLQSLSHA